jgi:hypothetical protein
MITMMIVVASITSRCISYSCMIQWCRPMLCLLIDKRESGKETIHTTKHTYIIQPYNHTYIIQPNILTSYNHTTIQPYNHTTIQPYIHTYIQTYIQSFNHTYNEAYIQHTYPHIKSINHTYIPVWCMTGADAARKVLSLPYTREIQSSCGTCIHV